MKRLLVGLFLLAQIAQAQPLELKAPGAVIEGIVVDSRGKPLEGVDLGLSDDMAAHVRREATGPDGRFRFTGLLQGRLFDLWVDRPGFVQMQVPRVAAPTPKPLLVQLVEARSLKGRVVDPEGRPVVGARVALVETVRGRLLGGGFVEGSWGSSQARTDAEGRFVLDRLPPGTIGFEVRAAGFRNRSVPGVRIPEEGEAEPVEISLEPGPFLEGRVLDSRGRPVRDAMVRAEGALQASGSFSFGGTRTDAEGRYQIGGLEPGPHTVTVQLAAQDPGTKVALEIRPGPNRLDVQIPEQIPAPER